MDRRLFLGRAACALASGGVLASAGCWGSRAQVLRHDQKDMVGNTAAGSETFKPLVEECVGKILSQPRTTGKSICFVGVENRSSEDLGDFKDHLVETIDNKIDQSGTFKNISRRFVDEGLRQARLRPEELFITDKRVQFLSAMQAVNQPFDYLLFARLTSGTTRSGKDAQRDYLLTLELVDIQTGAPMKASAEIRKGYYKSALGKLKNHG